MNELAYALTDHNTELLLPLNPAWNTLLYSFSQRQMLLSMDVAPISKIQGIILASLGTTTEESEVLTVGED